MKNNVARYFLDEIEEWRRDIETINDEIVTIEKKLEAIVRQNSITGIAAATEAHQSLLDAQMRQFDVLHDEFNRQEVILSPGQEPVDNDALLQSLRERQNELREKMKTAEKEYLDIKFSCHDFVSQMLK
jgi:phage terminase large subunit GpA-like protein